MAMGRFIHRDFFTSADLADLPAPARLMFAGMIVHADDSGTLREQPELFARVYCFGLGVRPCRVRIWLDALASRGCISRVILEGVSCVRITNFARFQALKRREGKRSEAKGSEAKRSEASLREEERAGALAPAEAAPRPAGAEDPEPDFETKRSRSLAKLRQRNGAS
jgi:hypothetical protein